MALKLGLLAFEFEKFSNLEYEHPMKDSSNQDMPRSSSYVQPIIRRAFEAIRFCIEDEVSCDLSLGKRSLKNITYPNDFLHVGRVMWDAELNVNDVEMSPPRYGIMTIVKFYRLEPGIRYKVTIDIEEMTSTQLRVDSQKIHQVGLMNHKLDGLAKSLNTMFDLNGRIEILPIITRGYYNVPRYLSTSDNRLVEYDFENDLICHIISDYQEISVVRSKSLGNLLLLNNRPSVCEIDKYQVNPMMDEGTINYLNTKCLILGGGDGALLDALLSTGKIKHVDLVEIDSKVLKVSSELFPEFGINLKKMNGENYNIIVKEAREYLITAMEDGIKWDIIFNDMTKEPFKIGRNHEMSDIEPELTQQNQPWFFIEPYYNLAMECLPVGGMFVMRLDSVNDDYWKNNFDRFLKNSNYDVNIKFRRVFVTSMMEISYFYTIEKLSMNKLLSTHCAQEQDGET